MARVPRRLKNCVELLERRLLFSAVVNATPVLVTPGVTASDVTPMVGPGNSSPFTPSQLRHFYGVDAISFGGTAGDGTGQTIAIVDAYDQPGFVNSTDPNFSTKDLHKFDAAFGLPDPPSFRKINEEDGSITPTAYDPNWGYEESLDVEWVHAMAPNASIILVECDDAESTNLYQGVIAAQNITGVTAISMSFGTSEDSSELSTDSEFVSTSSNPGITYVASAGDTGSSGTGYPAFSPRVVSVGGTSSTASDTSGTYGSETVWNDSSGATGGAASSIEAKPAYQTLLTPNDGSRDVPDVALDADLSTGVYVYNSTPNPSNAYYEVGGTSLSAPCWAGLIAVADQGRALHSLAPLDGFSQTLPRLYALSSADFHDITSGDNSGESAGAGYDLTTGRGSPIAQQLVPDLAGDATITGRVFQDNNGNNTFDGLDTPFAGKTVYLDLNNNGVQDAGEPTAVTDSTGTYTFTDQIGGLTGKVRLASVPLGFVLDAAATAFTTTYATTQTLNLGYFPTAYSTAVTGSAYTLRLDSTGNTEQILVNGVVTYSASSSIITTLSFSLTGTGDGLTIDGTNGNPVPAGGITFTGATTGDVLTVIGTASGNDSFNVSSSSISFGAAPINFSNVSSLMLNPGTGTDSLAVTSGSVTVTPQSPGLGILTRNFSNLSVSSGGAAIFATAPLHSDRTVVVTASLSVIGKLDLGGNDMIVHNGNLNTITAKVAAGFSGGSWTGTGIASAAAAADTTHLTAIGAISNNLGSSVLYSAFDGQTAVATDVLIKYTYYGDATLDGKVDASDYSRIDNAHLTGGTGWFNGDFNYDGAVNGSDYTLIDNAFNRQGARL